MKTYLLALFAMFLVGCSQQPVLTLHVADADVLVYAHPCSNSTVKQIIARQAEQAKLMGVDPEYVDAQVKKFKDATVVVTETKKKFGACVIDLTEQVFYIIDVNGNEGPISKK